MFLTLLCLLTTSEAHSPPAVSLLIVIMQAVPTSSSLWRTAAGIPSAHRSCCHSLCVPDGHAQLLQRCSVTSTLYCSIFSTLLYSQQLLMYAFTQPIVSYISDSESTSENKWIPSREQSKKIYIQTLLIFKKPT